MWQFDCEFDDAVVPVENIDAPLPMFSAEDDPLWPSWTLTGEVTDRLRDHEGAHESEHVCFEEASHHLWAPYLSTTGRSGGRSTETPGRTSNRGRECSRFPIPRFDRVNGLGVKSRDIRFSSSERRKPYSGPYGKNFHLPGIFHVLPVVIETRMSKSTTSAGESTS